MLEKNGSDKKLSVLISDPPLSTKQQKCDMAKVLFDNLNVENLLIMNSAVLSLFSTGRTTGIVIESGSGITTAVPIFEGYALNHAIQRIDLAGDDVSNHLLEALMSQGVNIDHNYLEFV